MTHSLCRCFPNCWNSHSSTA